MINIKDLKKIGYGYGFGGTFSKKAKYTQSHKKALKYFCQSNQGNFVDTSILYGEGDSEKIIGNLKDNLKRKIFISTKVSSENLKFKKFIDSCNQSLKNLKLKKIDLIQPHWPNYDIKNEEIINAFRSLKRKNKVRFFGLSNYDLKDIKFFKKRLKNSFKFIQDEFSLRDRELERKITFCEKNDIKIVCYSPFGAGGILYTKSELKLLNTLSEKYKKSFSVIILNFLASRSKNIILIPHTKKILHLRDNLSSLNFQISKADLSKIDKCFKTKYIKLRLKSVVYFNRKYKKIRSLKDALNNTGSFSPSPKLLASKLKKGHKLKPIKLKKIGKKYFLKEGRLRFWAHVIAFGWNKKIDMIIL